MLVFAVILGPQIAPSRFPPPVARAVDYLILGAYEITILAALVLAFHARRIDKRVTIKWLTVAMSVLSMVAFGIMCLLSA